MSEDNKPPCHTAKCSRLHIWRVFAALVVAGSLAVLLFGAHVGIEMFSKNSEIFIKYRNISLEKLSRSNNPLLDRFPLLDQQSPDSLDVTVSPISRNFTLSLDNDDPVDVTVSEAFVLSIELISSLCLWLSVMLALVFVSLLAVFLRFWKAMGIDDSPLPRKASNKE